MLFSFPYHRAVFKTRVNRVSLRLFQPTPASPCCHMQPKHTDLSQHALLCSLPFWPQGGLSLWAAIRVGPWNASRCCQPKVWFQQQFLFSSFNYRMSYSMSFRLCGYQDCHFLVGCHVRTTLSPASLEKNQHPWGRELLFPSPPRGTFGSSANTPVESNPFWFGTVFQGGQRGRWGIGKDTHFEIPGTHGKVLFSLGKWPWERK